MPAAVVVGSGVLACEQGCVKAAQALGLLSAKQNQDLLESKLTSPLTASQPLPTENLAHPQQTPPLAPPTALSRADQLQHALREFTSAYYQPNLAEMHQQLELIKQLLSTQQLYLKQQPAKFYTTFKFPAKELLALNGYELLSKYLAIAGTPAGIIGLKTDERALLGQLLAGQIRAQEQTLTQLLVQAKLPENSPAPEQADLQAAIKQQQRLINQQCRLWCHLATAGTTAFTGQFLYAALQQQVLSAVKYSFTHEGNTSLLYAYALVWLERLEQQNPQFNCAPAIITYLVSMTCADKAHAAIDQLNLTKAHRAQLMATDIYYRNSVATKQFTGVKLATPTASTPGSAARSTSPVRSASAELECSDNETGSTLGSPSLQSVGSPERHTPDTLDLDRVSPTVSPITHGPPTPEITTVSQPVKTAAATQAAITAALAHLAARPLAEQPYYSLATVKALTNPRVAATKKLVATSGARYKIGNVTYSC